MQIANPIYDSVFKYLMDDNQLAKLILSTIIDEDIIELVFCPQEYSSTIDTPRLLTVYRLDFAARIKNAQGQIRQVLIEIQKAKLPSDIMRFRRYLGHQYRNPNNTAINAKGEKQALPLLTVYFLGHPLEHSEAPVIHVRRNAYDVTTEQPLNSQEVFIESLTHDSYIIQIPFLKSTLHTEVEVLLQIFNQKQKIWDNDHILEIKESNIPDRYRPILRRLQRAAAKSELQDKMDLEDDILEDLQDMERQIEQERTKVEKEREKVAHERAKVEQATIEKEQAEADKARAEVDKNRAEVDKTRAEADKNRAEADKNRAEADKNRAEADKNRAEAQVEQERTEKERLLKLLQQAGIKF